MDNQRLKLFFDECKKYLQNLRNSMADQDIIDKINAGIRGIHRIASKPEKYTDAYARNKDGLSSTVFMFAFVHKDTGNDVYWAFNDVIDSMGGLDSKVVHTNQDAQQKLEKALKILAEKNSVKTPNRFQTQMKKLQSFVASLKQNQK